jgi:antitoxin MazE
MAARATAIEIVAIGNSRGIRIPRAVLVKYGFSDEAILEERPEGALLKCSTHRRLSWRSTYSEMAAERNAAPQMQDEWEAFDAASADGLGKLPW